MTRSEFIQRFVIARAAAPFSPPANVAQAVATADEVAKVAPFDPGTVYRSERETATHLAHATIELEAARKVMDAAREVAQFGGAGGLSDDLEAALDAYDEAVRGG